MVPYPSKGRGARPLLPPFPFLLCNARGRGILLAKNHQDENAIAQTHISDSDRSAQPRERASIYRLFSALLAKEPSAEFLAQAASLAPTVQGELGEYFASRRGGASASP